MKIFKLLNRQIILFRNNNIKVPPQPTFTSSFEYKFSEN